eukprot:365550-Pleurochrysis_carterae.AAC.1
MPLPPHERQEAVRPSRCLPQTSSVLPDPTPTVCNIRARRDVAMQERPPTRVLHNHKPFRLHC